MKLYTEEQVRHAIKIARSSYNIFTTPFIYNEDEVLQQLTPIELPSDEEISKEATDLFGKTTKIYISIIQCKAFNQGAEWMRDKIQGDNKWIK